MRRPVRFRWSLCLLLAGALALAGCKSAEELYVEGEALEAEGRYAEAAWRYLESLKREDSEKARGRLREAGARAVDEQLAEADAAQAAGDAVGAANAYLGADALVAAAARVGVDLPRPDAYEADLRAAVGAAYDALRAVGDQAQRAGAFGEAVRAYDRAFAYALAREQEAALDAGRAAAYAGWAEGALEAGRFRTAYDRAERALGYAPGDRALLDLRAAILDAGSVRLAAFPTETRGGRATRGLPADFREALNDRLEDEVWSRPPLFVVAAYPADVRRAIRRLAGSDERLGRPGTAAELARLLDADLAVASRLDAFARAETERAREAREAGRDGGGTATYTAVDTDLTLSATVAYEVVDARSRRVVCEGEAERSVTRAFERGEFRGRPGDLALDRDERRRFDAEYLAEREQALEQDLRRALAEHLADRVYACVEREIP